MTNVYKILARKSGGKSPLRGPRHGWEGVKMRCKYCVKVWTIFFWLRIGTSGRQL